MKINLLILILLAFGVLACSSSNQKLSDSEYAALTDEQKHSVEYALEGLHLEDKELEISLFASEPMMRNPTDMDVDDRGRVWITEGFNYRNKLNPRNPYDDKGDRILIMEDTDGDGKADTSKVFYQGEDINSALGIGVFGNRVIVSRSPYVFIFTDENGDDIPDKKEILFEGIGGEDHDHGIHAFTFGPDGKFYFNYGNAGNGLLTKNGKPLLDPQGKIIRNDGKPYREGMVFRSDLEGNNVEVLGWNFRNNYEVTVDSYGRMWQSDNDDDGNRGTRINYVMDYGNYGFKDEMTGDDWRTRRINMSDSIPLKHWHLNDPGVVPNLLQTFAGSPTGIAIYEGDLLPQKYRNQILHTDAGPNILRAYLVSQDQAGFKATIANILDGSKRDNWFRPSDVTVAPDGSIFVSDWYDQGVGGHAMGDPGKGRVYRITPKNRGEYKVKKPDYSSIEGNIQALKSPNTATRYKAWVNLNKMGAEAEKALLTLWKGDDPRFKARAFWLLSKLPQKGIKYVEEAANDSNENIRVAAIRAARELKDHDFSALYLDKAGDESPQVRREVAVAIRFKPAKDAWLKLAKAYHGNDRWYLEALGIGAEGAWNTYLPAYLSEVSKDLDNKAVQDIVWRSRSAITMDLLAQIISKNQKDNARYYRAMYFQKEGDRNSILLSLMSSPRTDIEKKVIFEMLDLKDLNHYPKLKEELKTLLSKLDAADFLGLAKKYEIPDLKGKILNIIRTNNETRNVQSAAQMYIDLYGIDEMVKLFNDKDKDKAMNAIAKFGVLDKDVVTGELINIFENKKLDLDIRKEAMEAMNGWDSEQKLWAMIKANEVPDDVLDIAKKHMFASWHGGVRQEAIEMFGDKTDAEIDPKKLLTKKGDTEKGKEVFETYCISCHVVKGKGVDFGPALSQIGGKLSKEGLFNAIINPSEGIGFGYETHQIVLKDGMEIQALVNAKTENELVVKLPGQAEQTRYALSDVKSDTELKTSLMPKFPLEEEQLINLLEYLGELK